jgi:hypothetical protein
MGEERGVGDMRKAYEISEIGLASGLTAVIITGVFSLRLWLRCRFAQHFALFDCVAPRSES